MSDPRFSFSFDETSYTGDAASTSKNILPSKIK